MRAQKNIETGSNLVDGRYRIEERLGKGGMGTVYRVYDTAFSRRLAIKILGRRAARSRTLSILFEREYHTLAQLAHPSIIGVYDYGVDESTGTAYYTMELLDGADLRELSPLGWKEACRLIWDVASSLALLHSRRLLHRDISARNVRCTAKGKAKLIDFGAMATFGTPPKLIGTPSFVSPEAYHLQSLDQRSDLYSLGALAYWLVAGRNAYPARELALLPDTWRSRPKPLSEIATEIPMTLNDLVMALLALDRIARPFCAAEVMERLAAIANLEVDEQLLVSQSYLSTPTLVGRGEQILCIRKQLIRARCGQGRALVIRSQSGMGRSRLLDACVLESKLLGASVLRVNAVDAHSGKWGAVRAIVRQLLDIGQDAVDAAQPHLSVLGNMFPEINERGESSYLLSLQTATFTEDSIQETKTKQANGRKVVSLEKQHAKQRSLSMSISETDSIAQPEAYKDPVENRPQVQAALRDWLIEVSRNRLLMIAVDDVDRIDEPSAAFLALLSSEIEQYALIVAVTTGINVSNAVAATSLKLIQQTGVTLELSSLDLESTEALLSSVFGEVPNVKLLAYLLYKESQGSPSAIMKIAQHLVDKGFVRYQSGAWTLPNRIDIGDLPDSLSGALRIQVKKLSEEARVLAQALALSPEQSISVDECLLISGIGDKSHLVHVVNELLALEIVSTDGRRYALSQQGWVPTLIEDLDVEQSHKLHLRLAEMFTQRGNDACRVAKHFFEAGHDEQALDVLVDDSKVNKTKIEASSNAYSEFVISLPREWENVYKRALCVADRLRRPQIQSYLLKVMIARIGYRAGVENTIPIKEVVQRLIRDSGLDVYQKLDESVEAEQRLQRAVALTQKRFDTNPPAQRVLSYPEAISELTKTLRNVMGIAANSYDYELLDDIPSLEPLALLSPALGIISKSISSVKYVIAGYYELAARGFTDIIHRISQPDRAGLDETTYRHVDLGHRFAIALIKASFGKRVAVKWTEEIEKHPLHQVNAWRIRMVYHLRRGEFQKAEECKRKIEVLQIQNTPTQFYEGVHQFAEVTVYTQCDDLIRVKRSIPGLELMARRFAPWVPILHYARGEYQRIRGDFNSALIELEKGLTVVKPGRHAVWPTLVCAYINTLYKLGRIEDARRYGEDNLHVAENIGLEFSACIIRVVLSIVQASLGEFENAIENCHLVINLYQRLGSEGITLGSVYEARARVAIMMNDQENFDEYAKLCAGQYRAGHNPVLTAKYERLIQAAREANMRIPEEIRRAAELSVSIGFDVNVMSQTRKELIQCAGLKQRFEKALNLIVHHTNSKWGYLYLMQHGELNLVAQDTEKKPPPDLLLELRAFIDRFVGEERHEQTDQSEIPTRSSFLQSCVSHVRALEPILLSTKIETELQVVGVAVVCRKPGTPYRPNYGLYQSVASCLIDASQKCEDERISESKTVSCDRIEGERYQTKTAIGQGGMGSVYIAYDSATQKNLALKRALVQRNCFDNQPPSQNRLDDTQKSNRWQRLLQQEYQTLQSLAHPRIVEVYDFGVDEKGPYYTMELLDGEDVRHLAPLKWRKACALLCDVASALSLLHSRKLLHRDVTARNVRCTADGHAKLMDFGAMAPMGPSKDVVGTPPHMPPESIYNQASDQRSDLYGLGALAYWLLTGIHAYPASKPGELSDLWRTRPALPSSVVPEIPEALDTLVMSMMSLDPMGRPSCAAEVMERFSAIASISLDEQLIVRQAYLSTPGLVGREQALLRIRKQMIRSIRSRGGAVLVKGAAGTGRSRFLDACVLEGKLAGLAVLRADASDAQGGDYAVTRALVQQLMREIPEIARCAAEPHLSILRHVIPQLIVDSETTLQKGSKTAKGELSESSDLQQLRPKIQAALRQWFIDVARSRALVIAVDDVHRIDEPSAAFIALLADQARDNRLAVVATSESDASGASQRALSLLSQAGITIELGNLEQAETEKLFISVFGDVLNVRLVADRLHAISGGNPKTLMQLAQHLLDNERVVYQAGAWTLPSQIDADDLPHTLSEARKLRIQALEKSERELAQTIALYSKDSLSYRDCLKLTRSDPTRLDQELRALVVSEILSTNGERYSLSHESWRGLLEEAIDSERAKTLHLRLASFLEKEGNDQFRVAQHLLDAGKEDRAVDTFVAAEKENRHRILRNIGEFQAYFRSLPKDWLATFESLLQLCKKLNRPQIEYFRIQARLIGCAAVTAKPVQSHINESAAQLYRDSGLDLYYRLSSRLDPSSRLQKALELTQNEFDDTKESERVLAPVEAISQLAQTIVLALGSVGNADDYPFLESLPSLVPMYPLSPALEVIDKNLQGTRNRFAGRFEQSHRELVELLNRLEQPDHAKLDASIYNYTRLAIIYKIGQLEVVLGLPSAPDRANAIEKDPRFEVNAWRLRMLFALQQGDHKKVKFYRKQTELLRIQNSPTQFFEGDYLSIELRIYAASDDLVGVIQLLPLIEKMADRNPGWVPTKHLARAEYQRLRGDHAIALSEFERALKLIAPGRHQNWELVVRGKISALLSLGRIREAKTAALEALSSAERQQLGISALTSIRQHLALAQVALGEIDKAIENANIVIENLEKLDITGLVLGNACETRARVAVAAHDQEDFNTYSKRCAELYRVGKNPVLTAKYQRLTQAASKAGLRLSEDELELKSEHEALPGFASDAIHDSIASCRDRRQRSERVLELLMEHCDAVGGLLFGIRDNGLICLSRSENENSEEIESEIYSLAELYLAAEIEESATVTMTAADHTAAHNPGPNAALTLSNGKSYEPLVLFSKYEGENKRVVVGLAALVPRANKLKIPSAEFVSAIGNALLDTGDVVSIYAAV